MTQAISSTSHAPAAPPVEVSNDAEVAAAIDAVLANHKAISLASAGGEFSPWVLGAYFAHRDGALFLGLENSGKTMRNLLANPSVAFLVTSGDAQHDFVQGQGTVTLLTCDQAAAAEALIKAKMPWYQTYTPTTFVRLDVTRFWVSSFSRQWFPAKQLAPTQGVASVGQSGNASTAGPDSEPRAAIMRFADYPGLQIE